MENETLATEMLRELKATSKRKDIIIIVLIIVLLVSNIAWFVYESQFETIETQEQYIDDIDNSNNSNFMQTIN